MSEANVEQLAQSPSIYLHAVPKFRCLHFSPTGMGDIPRNQDAAKKLWLQVGEHCNCRDAFTACLARYMGDYGSMQMVLAV